MDAPAAAPTDAPPAAPPARVYVDGVFDLFHAGHLQLLKKAREAGGAGARLVVGVITDEAAAWKRRPVIPHAQRLEMLRACRLVDEIVPRPPLVLTEDFIASLGITLVVHGDDDPQAAFFKVPRALGIMRYVPYTARGPYAVSTSEIIARIRARAPGGEAPPRDGPAGEGAP